MRSGLLLVRPKQDCVVYRVSRARDPGFSCTMCSDASFRTSTSSTFVGLAANDLGVMAVHINGAQTAISSLGRSFCSVLWGLTAFAVMYSGSLVRGFRRAGPAALLSAGTMFAGFIVVIVGELAPANRHQDKRDRVYIC